MNDPNLDRFARGDLSPTEARELAQKALSDPQLFEELTYTSVAKQSMSRRHSKRNLRLIPILLAAAATLVVGVVSVTLMRSSHEAPAGNSAAAQPAVLAGPPVFLARRTDSKTAFRSEEPQSRAPRAAGAVSSLTPGSITVELGSLDGLQKGAEVEVLRDGSVIGRVPITTVFRERSRGAVPAGLAIRMTDQIRLPGPLYLRAVLDQIAAAAGRGDAPAALLMAANAPVEAIAAITPSTFDDWNNLGAIAELHGDRSQAEALYEKALGADPPPEARASIEANIARTKSVK